MVLLDAIGRVAFQQRDDAVLPDGRPVWGLFGGWIEGDESPAETALREIREELGCTLDASRLEIHHVRSWLRDGVNIECHVFRYETGSELQHAVLAEGLAWEFRHPQTLSGQLLPHHEEITSDAALAR